MLSKSGKTDSQLRLQLESSQSDRTRPNQTRRYRLRVPRKKRALANLPETHKGRWGEGLAAADMEKCVWVRPEIVARIEFREWTESDHLRHAKFAGLREDKNPRSVIKEEVG